MAVCIKNLCKADAYVWTNERQTREKREKNERHTKADELTANERQKSLDQRS